MTLAQVAQHLGSQQSARNLPTEGTRTDQTEQTDLGFETKTGPWSMDCTLDRRRLEQLAQLESCRSMSVERVFQRRQVAPNTQAAKAAAAKVPRSR